MFKTRLISGIVLVILLAATLILGGPVLWGMLLLTSLAGLREFYQAIGSGNKQLKKERWDILAIAGYVTCVLWYVLLGAQLFGAKEGVGFEHLLLLLLAALLVFMCIYVFTYPKYQPSDLMSTLFGILYIPAMLSMIYLIRGLSRGIYLVWLVFVCSWVCDTFAYCVGVLFGKHKMAPVLSPKKSVEGAVGGVAGAALVGAIFGFVLVKIAPADFTGMEIGLFALIGGIGGACSQIGDLTASAIKRHYGIKDYGALIPGHGGILDRFDSVIVTAPIIYLIMTLFG